MRRPDGVFAQAAAAASVILSRQWDPELGLAFAAMLLCFSRDAANQGVLACKEALQLLCVLLQVRFSTAACRMILQR